MKKEIKVVPYLKNQHLDFEVVASVYQTSDYSKLKTFSSNRIPDHVGNIISNIIEKGYISNPIITSFHKKTGDLMIIDGNNRFNALKELGIPVSFVILDGADENSMVALNIVSKNWTKENFIKFYACNGYEQYEKFIQIHEEYPDFKWSTLENVLKLSCESDTGYSKRSTNKVANGTFKIKDIEKSREILDFCMNVKKIQSIDTVYNRNNFVLAIMRIFRIKEFDKEKMLAKMNTNKSLIIAQNEIKSYANMLEDIYNTRTRKGDVKVHFDI